jgi:hypothetical protein
MFVYVFQTKTEKALTGEDEMKGWEKAKYQKISSAEATKNQWKNFIASKLCSRLPSFDILVFPVKLKNRKIGRCSRGFDNGSKYVEILLSCDKESKTVVMIAGG